MRKNSEIKRILSEKHRTKEIVREIEDKQKVIQQKEGAISRIDDAYENGIYSRDKYRTRIRKAESDLHEAKEAKRLLQVQLSMVAEKDTTKRFETLMEFLGKIQDSGLSYEDQNDLYKTIIKSIAYTRTDRETIDIKINFK